MSLVVAAAGRLGRRLAQAPAPPAAEPQLPPQYEVEILVFANRNFDPTEERFEATPNGFGDDAAALREVPVFDDTNFGPLAPLHARAAARPSTRWPRSEPKRCVSGRCRPEELKLGNEYREAASDRSLSSRSCMRAGCSRACPEADAEPFDLKVLGVLNPRGTVRVHLSRFLHITLDLTYQADADVSAWGRQPSDGLDELVLAPRYHLVADAQRAQQRAALLRPSGVRSARARDAGAGARRARAAGRRPDWATREPRGPARRWRVRPPARAR